jgi:hypothetical protein
MGTTSPTSGWTQLLPGFLVTGVGIGLINPVLASASVAVVPVERSGMASGANFTFRQVGIATGIAGLGAVFASRIQHHSGPTLGSALQSGGIREALPAIPAGPARTALLTAYRVGFSHTFNELMVISAVISLVGAILTFFLVRQSDFVHDVVGAAGAGTP